MPDKCIKAFISGKVQGVFFRDSTRREANRLGVTGYAKNLSDGRVEVVACGDTHKIDLLVNWLQSGSKYARVEYVALQVIDIEIPEDFLIW